MKIKIFPTPYDIFRLDLTTEEIAIYLYLLKCKNKDYQCWPSYKTIGENVNLCKSTVKKYVDSLCEKQLIYTEPTYIYKNGMKVNGNLKYTIRPIKDAIKYNIQHKFDEHDKAMYEKYQVELDEMKKKSS